MHGNPEGHARIAGGFAQLLGLPGADDAWLAPLNGAEPRGLRARLVEDARWGKDFFAPWLWRRIRGRSAGDGQVAKRPVLEPIRPL